MKAELIESWGTDLTAVNAARISKDKESDWDRDYDLSQPDGIDLHGPFWDNKLKKADEKLIHYLAANKHFGCFEHQGATLRLHVPLFIRSQIHRHRSFAYNEISRRYVKDNPEFYWPDKWRKAAENVKQGSSDEEAAEWVHDPNGAELLQGIHNAMAAAYNYAINSGVCPEQARMILPQNLYTTFYMTGNLRSWTHFLKLRLDSHSQREMQEKVQQESWHTHLIKANIEI